MKKEEPFTVKDFERIMREKGEYELFSIQGINKAPILIGCLADGVLGVTGLVLLMVCICGGISPRVALPLAFGAFLIVGLIFYFSNIYYHAVASYQAYLRLTKDGVYWLKTGKFIPWRRIAYVEAKDQLKGPDYIEIVMKTEDRPTSFFDRVLGPPKVKIEESDSKWGLAFDVTLIRRGVEMFYHDEQKPPIQEDV